MNQGSLKSHSFLLGCCFLYFTFFPNPPASAPLPFLFNCSSCYWCRYHTHKARFAFMVAMEILLIKSLSFLQESTCDVLCSPRSVSQFSTFWNYLSSSAKLTSGIYCLHKLPHCFTRYSLIFLSGHSHPSSAELNIRNKTGYNSPFPLWLLSILKSVTISYISHSYPPSRLMVGYTL